jgi:hypothetical protein
MAKTRKAGKRAATKTKTEAGSYDMKFLYAAICLLVVAAAAAAFFVMIWILPGGAPGNVSSNNTGASKEQIVMKQAPENQLYVEAEILSREEGITFDEARIISRIDSGPGAPAPIRAVRCADSDGGRNAYTQGKLMLEYDYKGPKARNLSDLCSGADLVVEHWCQGNSGRAEMIMCNSGCSGGACVFSGLKLTVSEGKPESVLIEGWNYTFTVISGTQSWMNINTSSQLAQSTQTWNVGVVNALPGMDGIYVKPLLVGCNVVASGRVTCTYDLSINTAGKV